MHPFPRPGREDCRHRQPYRTDHSRVAFREKDERLTATPQVQTGERRYRQKKSNFQIPGPEQIDKLVAREIPILHATSRTPDGMAPAQHDKKDWSRYENGHPAE